MQPGKTIEVVFVMAKACRADRTQSLCVLEDQLCDRETTLNDNTPLWLVFLTERRDAKTQRSSQLSVSFNSTQLQAQSDSFHHLHNPYYHFTNPSPFIPFFLPRFSSSPIHFLLNIATYHFIPLFFVPFSLLLLFCQYFGHYFFSFVHILQLLHIVSSSIVNFLLFPSTQLFLLPLLFLDTTSVQVPLQAITPSC